MKQKPIIRWGLVLAAGVIFLNPMPMLFDVLPDALGFLFLWFAFGRVAELLPSFAEVKETGNKLLLITALKIPAFVIMLLIWGGDPNQRPIVAVFCLAFAILELCYLIPWIHRLFDAFYHLGEHYACHAAIAQTGQRFRLPPAKLEVLTVVFFSVRGALSCLPEMTLVPIYNNEIDYVFNWNTLYVPFMIVAGVLVLVLGIIWYCYFAAYVSRMAKETETAELLNTRSLEEPSVRRNQFLYLKLATLFYVLGVITTFDLYVDRMNYLPDAVSALFFCGCGYCLSRLLHGRRSNWILPLVWGAVSLVHTGLSVRFFREYTIAAIERVQAAEQAYRLVLVSAAASEALMAGVVILLFFSFRTVVRRYTGIPGADVRYTKTEMATRRELTVKSLWVAVLGCLTAAVSFCYEVTLATTVDVATDTTYTSGRLTIPYLDWFWIVVWVAGGIWLILSLHTSGRLREEAEMNLLDA